MSQNFKKIYNINKFIDIILKYCTNEKKKNIFFHPLHIKN